MIVLNFILTLFLSLGANPTQTPPVDTTVVACDARAYKDACLNKLPDGFTFLKSYTIDGRGGTRSEIRYSYIFSKNNTYMIMLNNGQKANRGFYVELYDSNQRRLASSYISQKDTFYEALQYTCTATGIYHLRFKFDNKANSNCAGSVLAFKR